MNIRSKIINIQDRTNPQPMSEMSISRSALSSSNNQYQERPLKTNSHDFSFKGLSVNSSEVVNSFKNIIGDAGEKNVSAIIEKIGSQKNPWVEKQNDLLTFKEETMGFRLYHSIIDPIVNFPLDLANGFLGGLKNFSMFKKSAVIDKMLENPILKDRKNYQTLYSNTMAIQHHAEMLKEIEKLKNGPQTPANLKKLKAAEQAIIAEAQKRLNPEVANYTTKAERSFTRLASGIVPAFFLANDAYNLSMYMNNNKDLAAKEKKRRFNQEIIRVVVTAGATFGALGFFAKKSNAHPGASTFIIAGTTLASEVIGRMMTGVPFIPITANQAKKYAQKENKNKPEDKIENKTKNISTDPNTKKDSKSMGILEFVGGMMLVGFAIEKAPMHIKPVKQFIEKISGKYKSLMDNDYTITKGKFDEILKKLKDNGFNELAKNYEEQVNKIIKNGNLTAQESYKLETEINKRAEAKVSGLFIKDPKAYKDKVSDIKKKLPREAIMAELNIKPSNPAKDEDILHLGKFISKPKSVMDQIFGLPIRVVWDIINMPYKIVAKPLIELPKQIKEGSFIPAEKSSKSGGSALQNGLSFLKKINDDVDYKEKLNNSLLDSYDNVSKSNFSNAELGGAAKTAVSSVTSAFLVFDNYNRVMIDSEGEDTKLAGQKAQERTVQRLVRIAYGAGLIKLFNNVFSKQYNGSLLGAQLSNVGQSVVTETLERTSVGLPLHESTREEIIANDKKNVEAKGIQGAYFKLMASLTGKKPLSEISG